MDIGGVELCPLHLPRRCQVTLAVVIRVLHDMMHTDVFDAVHVLLKHRHQRALLRHNSLRDATRFGELLYDADPAKREMSQVWMARRPVAALETLRDLGSLLPCRYSISTVLFVRESDTDFSTLIDESIGIGHQFRVFATIPRIARAAFVLTSRGGATRKRGEIGRGCSEKVVNGYLLLRRYRQTAAVAFGQMGQLLLDLRDKHVCPKPERVAYLFSAWVSCRRPRSLRVD